MQLKLEKKQNSTFGPISQKNKAKYGNVVSEINEYYAKTNLKSRHDNYLMQLMRTTTYGPAPANLGNTLLAYFNENEAKRAEILPKLNALIETVYGKFYAPLEKDIFIAQLNLYTSKGSEFGLSPMLAKLKEENKGDFTSVVIEAVSKSIFASQRNGFRFL